MKNYSDGELNEEERQILKVANLLEIYDYCEKKEDTRIKVKIRLRKSKPKESFTSTVSKSL